MKLVTGLLALAIVLTAVPSAVADGIPIGGTVVGPGGSPLPRLEVQLLESSGPAARARAALRSEEIEPSARALTDDQGRFRLEAPGAGLWRVRIAAAGFVPVETRPMPLLEPVELPEVELSADEGVRVRVLDPSGAAVPDVLVGLRTDRARRVFRRSAWDAPARHARTDADGVAILPRGESERVTLTAAGTAAPLVERRGVPGAVANLRFPKASERLIEVRSAEGRPEPGVVVLGGRHGHPLGTTDESGRIAIAVGRSRAPEIGLHAADGRTLESRLEPPREDGAPQVLTLPARFELVGSVIDAESRKAIVDGLVWDEQNPLVAAVTDGDGSFSLGVAADSRLRLSAGAAGFLPDFAMEFRTDDPERPGPTLALKPAAAVEGTVVDGNGAPVVGAEIELEKKHAPGMMRIEFGRPRPTTRNLSDRRGKFRLGPVDPEQRYSIRASAEGFAPAEQPLDDLEPYRTRSGVTIEMNRGRAVVGRVIDQDSSPLREVAVTVSPARPSQRMGMMQVMEGPASDLSFAGVTDDDGRFRIEGIPAGTVDLEAKRTGFASQKKPGVEVAESDEPVDVGDVVLQPGESLRGYVIDGDGAPIEGVQVFVDEGGPSMMLMLGDDPGNAPDPASTTDPSGWFSVDDLSAERKYSLRFDRAGYVDANAKGLDVPRPDPVEVVMDAASDVSGIVLDEEGEPIAGAQVDLQRRQTIEMGGNVMMTMMMEDTSSGADGRFRFEDQTPGTVGLSGVAPGFQEAKLGQVEIPKGQDLENLELVLPRGAVLTGRVFAPDGRPVIGARVDRIAEQSGGPRFDMGGASTDGSGVYRLDGLAPGSISVEATHDEFPRAVRDIEVKEGRNELDLNFEGGVEVSGLVVDSGGKPVRDAVARLSQQGRFWGGPESRTAADGTFAIPGVQQGDYRLRVRAEGFAPSTDEIRVEVREEPVQGLEVRLEAGATIYGSVTGIAENERHDVSVEAQGAGHFDFGGVGLDAEGNYRVENLQPGDYTLVARAGDSGRSARATGTLESGAPELRIDLQFEPGFTLSGRAVQGESAVAGATVFVEGLDREHDGWGQTDHSGGFSIEGLQAGRYRVSLREFASGLSHQETVEMSGSKEIVIEVPTARISGVVVDSADRAPLSGVTLTLTSEDPSMQARLPFRTSTTDLEGRFDLDGVADGAWQLSATKEGYAAIARTVTVQFDRTRDALRLSMDPTEGMTLEVRTPTGTPANDVQVAVMDPSGGVLTSGTYSTGENGRVRLSSVPPGNWSVLLASGSSATSRLDVRAPGPAIPVVLEAPTQLRVTVPELAESGAIGTVRVTDLSGRPYRSLSWTSRPQSEWRMAGGQMMFGSLPAGTWNVTVDTSDGGSWSGQAGTSIGSPSELVLD